MIVLDSRVRGNDVVCYPHNGGGTLDSRLRGNDELAGRNNGIDAQTGFPRSALRVVAMSILL